MSAVTWNGNTQCPSCSCYVFRRQTLSSVLIASTAWGDGLSPSHLT